MKVIYTILCVIVLASCKLERSCGDTLSTWVNKENKKLMKEMNGKHKLYRCNGKDSGKYCGKAKFNFNEDGTFNFKIRDAKCDCLFGFKRLNGQWNWNVWEGKYIDLEPNATHASYIPALMKVYLHAGHNRNDSACVTGYFIK